MKKLLLIVFCLFAISKSLCQEAFEGVITFKTEITVPKSAKKVVLKNLNYRFGDSLQMYYSKTGNFKRKYLNSGITGLDYQTYNAEEGKLYIKNKNVEDLKFSDVTVNTLELVSLKKVENEFIINLDCECYEYLGRIKSESQDGKIISLTYCFSKLMEKVNLKAFENYNDFFINDYFKKNQRPYLKYVMKTDDLTLNFTAVKITNIDLKKVKI